MCHRTSLNCLLCQYSLSIKRNTFVSALPPGDVFRRSKRPCRHCPGSLCCLNPFGTCLEFLLNIRAGHSTTVCVLQQPYNQQSPCSATPLWKQRFDIGSTLEDQHMEWKPAGQPEHASLNQCQLIVANRCSGHPQQVVEIRFLCNVIDAGALIGPCSHVTSCCSLIC